MKGTGIHVATEVVPFTLRSLLLWYKGTGERARGARRLPPGYPGSRQRKSPRCGAFGLFPPAFGSGAILHPCRSPPLGASMRLAPACGQRLSDFQPDTGVAVCLLTYCNDSIALASLCCRPGKATPPPGDRVQNQTIGNVIRAQSPPSARFTNCNSPFNCPVSCAAIASPSPVPPVSRLREDSTR